MGVGVHIFWGMGCTLVELATGDALFQTHESLEHLAMMQHVGASGRGVGLFGEYPAFWGVGSILVELATGDALFQTRENLGPLPESMAYRAVAHAGRCCSPPSFAPINHHHHRHNYTINHVMVDRSQVLGPTPESMACRADKHSQKYFNGGRLDWPAGAANRKSLRAVSK